MRLESLIFLPQFHILEIGAIAVEEDYDIWEPESEEFPLGKQWKEYWRERERETTPDAKKQIRREKREARKQVHRTLRRNIRKELKEYCD